MTEWLHINKIEMLVVKAEYIYELSKSVEEINISCQLLNIARGRCEVKISKCFKDNFEKKLFISSKKAIMKAEIELNEKNFNNFPMKASLSPRRLFRKSKNRSTCLSIQMKAFLKIELEGSARYSVDRTKGLSSSVK